MSDERYLGFTGTRKPLTEAQKTMLVSAFVGFRESGVLWMRNGDCVGADEYAGRIWKSIGGRIHLHPPSNPRLRAHLPADASEEPTPYLARNRHIVDGSAMLVGTPFEAVNQFRGGTWSTLHYAHGKHLPTMTILPNGKMELRDWPQEAAPATSTPTHKGEEG